MFGDLILNQRLKMKRALTLLVIVSLLACYAVVAQQPAPTKTPNGDPNLAQIVSSDIDLFWKAYDKAKPENNINVF